MSIQRDIRTALSGSNGTLFRLIIINCVVFLAVNLIISFIDLSGDRFAYERVAQWITLPSDPHTLLFHPWTIITYMFLHFGFMHLLSNMLWLYFLGRIFSEFLGGFRLVATYIAGGIAGGLLFVLMGNVFPVLGGALEGASAGVMAIVIAVAAHSPDYPVFPFGIQVRLKWVGLIAFLLTSIVDISSNTGGKISHIGGAAFGLIYGSQLRNLKGGLDNFLLFFRPKKRSGKLRVEYRRSAKSSDSVYNTGKSNTQKRIDEILDKISKSGYDSLTKEEKDFLQKNHDRF